MTQGFLGVLGNGSSFLDSNLETGDSESIKKRQRRLNPGSYLCMTTESRKVRAYDEYPKKRILETDTR